MTVVLPLAFLTACGLCIGRPRAGLAALFGFAILVSNAKQGAFLGRLGQPHTFALVPESGLWVVDSLGVRILVLALLCGTLVDCFLERRRLGPTWLFLSLAGIILLGLISGIYNHSDPYIATSAMYFLVMPLLFLVTTTNLGLTPRDARRFLNGLFGFVCINAILQAYQFFFTANGNVDLTAGLLNSTTPTSTLAFAVLIPVLAGSVFDRSRGKAGMSVAIALVQLASSYLKGIVGFVIVVLLGTWRLLWLRGVRRGRALAYGMMLLIAGAGLFDALALDAGDVRGMTLEAVVETGPVRVWRQFSPPQLGLSHALLGYGPGSYGSLNTFAAGGGQLTSRLSEGVTGTSPASRDVFRLALSSTGNILWENGIVGVALFLWVHYRLYAISALVAREANLRMRALAIGVMGGVLFTILLYSLAYAETLEQPFLWGPAFVAFGAVETEAQRLRAAKRAARQAIAARERPGSGSRS